MYDSMINVSVKRHDRIEITCRDRSYILNSLSGIKLNNVLESR